LGAGEMWATATIAASALEPAPAITGCYFSDFCRHLDFLLRLYSVASTPEDLQRSYGFRLPGSPVRACFAIFRRHCL
jgi:hypothetical protein